MFYESKIHVISLSLWATFVVFHGQKEYFLLIFDNDVT